MSNVGRVAAQAANTLTAPLNVEDVFSTYLYAGNSSTQTITNGIDLAGEGGLVWVKPRSQAYSHYLYDSERSLIYNLYTNATNGNSTDANDSMDSFNSDGFTITGGANLNLTGVDYASWTFRKAPKFFDVVTATSIGSTSRVLSHNLGCDVGFAVVKRLDSTSNWISRHRSLTAGHNINLNTTQASFAFSGIVSFDSTTITINEANFLGTGNYVVYLFAHNNGDGDFGSTADQDIIKCGSFTSTSGTDEIDLGFEPQWILIKRADASNSWVLVDEMRGNPVGSAANYLEPNAANAEATLTGWTTPTPTGFTNSYPLAGGTFIYIAIRRGPMAVPESATDVFAVDLMDNSPTAPPALYTGFPVDMSFYRDVSTSANTNLSSRLTGAKILSTNTTDAETTNTLSKFDFMDGWFNYSGAIANHYGWMWRRAPNFFDVVAYTGIGGTSGQTINHNLGVVPELIIVKARSTTSDWLVYSAPVGFGYYMQLHNTSAAAPDGGVVWGDGSGLSDTTFQIGASAAINGSGTTYIAYLFASLDGVSKVGSYTGNGTSQTIDCGFSSGARFVLIKPTSATGHWAVFDTERGIVAGGDPYLLLNGTNAETTGFDELDPDNSGFIVNNSAGVANVNGVSYIFYAIA